MRKVKMVQRIQPLQMDTAVVKPNSVISGKVEQIINVVGTEFSKAIKAERFNEAYPIVDGVYRFTCTDTGKFTITNTKTGQVSQVYDATSSNVVTTNDLVGLKVTVTSGLTGVVAGDYTDVYVVGDSTYIVPGTILGKIKDKDNVYYGKYEPIGSDLSKYEHLRVCAGTLETDKQKLVPQTSMIHQLSDTLTVSVFVFAQLIESVCRDINMTDDAKAQLTGIVWE